jgi:hypothetical protein
MVERFPQIVGLIEEENDGFTVTIFLRTSPGFHGDTLLIDQATNNIDEAREIVSLAARQRSIPEDEVIIHILTDTRPSKGPAN